MDADLDDAFAALADPSRRAVIELLRAGSRRSGDIAETLGLSAPAASRHLRVLRQAGLVEEIGSPQDARVRMYSLRQASFVAVRDWLDTVESFWTDQLAAFQAHAERKSGRRDR